jgi:hypothetical protein
MEKTYLKRSRETGLIMDEHAGAINTHPDLKTAIAYVFFRYCDPIIRVVARNPKTGIPTGWIVRARTRGELATSDRRYFPTA